jgi:sugar phosphate isomerase/epimerase
LILPACEGCGTRTDEEHIKRRSERLELAARFRPIRIKVLLLDGAPPFRAEDYFYRVAKDRSERSLGARRYFDELMNAASVPVSTGSQEAALLAEFQRKGFFLTYAVECPFEEQDDPQAALRRLAPTVLKRVQSFHAPDYMVPMSKQTTELIRLFGMIGWGDRLVLDNGLPFVDPYLADPRHHGAIGTALGDRIKKALAFLP